MRNKRFSRKWFRSFAPQFDFAARLALAGPNLQAFAVVLGGDADGAIASLGLEIGGLTGDIASCADHFLAISLAFPIHNSMFSSASSRSNQRPRPLASIPTRTFFPCVAKSR